MNQQRSRRFRAAKEAKEKKMKEEQIKQDMIAKGITVRFECSSSTQY